MFGCATLPPFPERRKAARSLQFAAASAQIAGDYGSPRTHRDE